MNVSGSSLIINPFASIAWPCFSRNKRYFEFAHVTFHCIITKSSFHVDNPKKYSSANMKLINKKTTNQYYIKEYSLKYLNYNFLAYVPKNIIYTHEQTPTCQNLSDLD